MTCTHCSHFRASKNLGDADRVLFIRSPFLPMACLSSSNENRNPSGLNRRAMIFANWANPIDSSVDEVRNRCPALALGSASARMCERATSLTSTSVSSAEGIGFRPITRRWNMADPVSQCSGAMSGPTTSVGLITVRAVPVPWTIRQAARSARVFEME